MEIDFMKKTIRKSNMMKQEDRNVITFPGNVLVHPYINTKVVFWPRKITSHLYPFKGLDKIPAEIVASRACSNFK